MVQMIPAFVTTSAAPSSRSKVASPAYSVLRSSPAFVALAIAIAAAGNFADPDLWVHVLTGQRILTTGHVLLRDPYSYAAPGLPWYNHEWLTQVVFATFYRFLGIFGLKLVKLACASVIILALERALSRTTAPPAAQRIVPLAVATALMTQIQFRPTLFTLAFLSFVIAKLATEVYNGPAMIWLLIPLFALWANFHGGCFAGLGALGIFTVVVGCQEFYAKHTISRAWKISAVTLGCGLVTLLNPLGTGLWTTFIASASDPLMRPVIADWVPLFKFIVYAGHKSLSEPALYIVPLVLFAALPVLLFAGPAPDDAPLAVVALVFTVGAFYSTRNVGLAIIALSVPLARHLGIASRKWGFAEHDSDARSEPLAAVAIIGAILVAVNGGEFSNRLRAWEPLPKGAVAYMKIHGLRGNILNHADWGDYLIWQLTPRSKIFIDGRYQLVYPDKLRLEYLAFLYDWPGGETILNRHHHDFALLKPATGAYKIVASDPRWTLIYQDAVAALFTSARGPITRDLARSQAASRNDSGFPD